MISVIICTYNRHKSLRRTLDSLREMSVPDDLSWELIVVDNNSKDLTKEEVQEFTEKSGLPCRYVFEAIQGKCNALNRGIKEAKGEIIALTDDDVIVDKDWIRNIKTAFDNHEIACVGGKILPIWEKPRPKWVKGKLLDVLALLDLGDNVGKMKKPTLWGANLAVKSSMFQKYGTFDTTMGHQGEKIYGSEETKFIQDLLNGNEEILYDPGIFVYHCIPEHRLKKSYFRKWIYYKGELSAIQMGKYRHRNVVGIPLYVIKETTMEFLKYIWKQLTNPNNAFPTQLILVYKIGFIVGRVKNRNSYQYDG